MHVYSSADRWIDILILTYRFADFISFAFFFRMFVWMNVFFLFILEVRPAEWYQHTGLDGVVCHVKKNEVVTSPLTPPHG